MPGYLLHSSGDPQREYARQAASDGVITYSYSSDNFRWVEPNSSLRWPSSSITQNPQAADQQQATWIDTIFEFIDSITGVQFQKVEGQRGEIHLNFVPTLVNKRFKGNFTEGNIVDPVVNTESYGGSSYINGYGQIYSFHNQAQYGALSDIRGIQTTLLEILGVTTPNGNGDDPAYSWDNTLMSYNDGGLGSFGATFFLTADDKAALQTILGSPSGPSPSGSKTHIQKIKEDLMLGTDGVVDTFKLISKGMILKKDAGTQYDDLGVIYNNYNIPYVANFNPDDGDKILIHRSLLNPKSPVSQASKKLAKPFKKTKLRFKQIFGDQYTTGQNVYYNDAGKIYIDTNGKKTGLSSNFRYNSAGLAGQTAAFVDPIGPETIPFQSEWLGFFG
ncbi:hypothetical protein CB0101_08550 [Synechococcus sp. CB0101]|uniref:hypothetical protein n=1 Tax=Synechococcus sp. CB0101 TaxID=232348 RepID=UPI0010AAE9F1|nr:hypothetical protein [Synechococcus sp. CB0101]QCH14971.1 hypothetical protein CB0101_08550 [Synechococcus sp. CB0101]